MAGRCQRCFLCYLCGRVSKLFTVAGKKCQYLVINFGCQAFSNRLFECCAGPVCTYSSIGYTDMSCASFLWLYLFYGCCEMSANYVCSGCAQVLWLSSISL